MTRTVVVEVRDLTPEQKAVADGFQEVSGLEPPDAEPKPNWVGRVLTYEGWSCDYGKDRKRSPSQEALLDAFERGRWRRPLDVRSLLKERLVGDLHSTVRQLKKRVTRDGPAPITFKALGDDRAEWGEFRSTAEPPTPPKGSTRKTAAKGRTKKPTKKRKSK